MVYNRTSPNVQALPVATHNIQCMQYSCTTENTQEQVNNPSSSIASNLPVKRNRAALHRCSVHTLTADTCSVQHHLVPPVPCTPFVNM